MYLFNSLCELISIIYTAYFLHDVYSSQATYFSDTWITKVRDYFSPPQQLISISVYVMLLLAITQDENTQ